MLKHCSLCLIAVGMLVVGCEGVDIGEGTWVRHTIDSSLRGADGVKPGDLNGDGLTDLVVGWEESGRVVAYLHPGPAGIGGTWPGVVVGEVGDVEDAVFVDVDGDGQLDVVSCAEGDTRSIFVHWAPNAAELLDENAWRTEPLPAARGQRQWMFCAPAQIDGVNGVDLVAGAKGDSGQIGYFAAPAAPRVLAAWAWLPLADARWIMSIVPADVDGDGDTDIVYSDRKGDDRGCYWLENPAGAALPIWLRHRIGSADGEVMFLDLRIAGGMLELVVATDRRELRRFAPPSDVRLPWGGTSIGWSGAFGSGKGVRLGDVDGDGTDDIVFSCENAGGKAGVGRLTRTSLGGWTVRPISDNAGGKFDLIQLLDLDGDGDLDVVTTEEAAGLGVVWYENPAPVR